MKRWKYFLLNLKSGNCLPMTYNSEEDAKQAKRILKEVLRETCGEIVDYAILFKEV